MNLSPPNGSLTAHLVGEVNAATFECDIFHEQSSGELLQVTTTWTLQNFRSSGNQSILVLKSAFEEVFSIGGTARPPGSFSATFRNRLTVLSFEEDLDKAVLMCGSEAQGFGYFNLRVYSKFEICLDSMGFFDAAAL